MLLLCQLCRNGFELQELTSYNCLREVRAHTRKWNIDGFALENILHQVLELRDISWFPKCCQLETSAPRSPASHLAVYIRHMWIPQCSRSQVATMTPDIPSVASTTTGLASIWAATGTPETCRGLSILTLLTNVNQLLPKQKKNIQIQFSPAACLL